MPTLILLLIGFVTLAQESANNFFRKYPVESTGCYVKLPSEPGMWTLEKSEDGSDVYTISQVDEGLNFDVITVQFGCQFQDRLTNSKVC